MKVKKSDIGKFVRVEFHDIGAKDGIILDVGDKGKYVKYLDLTSMTVTDNNGADIIAIGNRVNAKHSGLTKGH